MQLVDKQSYLKKILLFSKAVSSPHFLPQEKSLTLNQNGEYNQIS